MERRRKSVKYSSQKYFELNFSHIIGKNCNIFLEFPFSYRDLFLERLLQRKQSITTFNFLLHECECSGNLFMKFLFILVIIIKTTTGFSVCFMNTDVKYRVREKLKGSCETKVLRRISRGNCKDEHGNKEFS